MGAISRTKRLPIRQYVSVTLNADNTTKSHVLWTVTGAVEILKLGGIVTTVLGSNVTAAHWRIDDQTAQPVITAAAGTTLSSAAAGSVILKTGLAAAALTLIDNSAGRVNHGAAIADNMHCPFIVTKKLNATTTIDFRYTTTNTPTSGVIQFYIEYVNLSVDGALT